MIVSTLIRQDYIVTPLWFRLVRLRIKRRIVSNATQIDFAARLWGRFRALMAGALYEIKPVFDDKLDLVMKTIDLHV